MSFSVHDLRYHLPQHYASLYAYLNYRAKRALGALGSDNFELDQVVSHVIEQLTRIGILGTGDTTPPTVLDSFTNAQFYAFLNRSIRNKAIDRLRKRHALTNTFTELERTGGEDDEISMLDTQVESLWGSIPYSAPEDAAIEAASQESLRRLLKDCIKGLSAAPRQLRALMQELDELGAGDLVEDIRKEYGSLFDNTSAEPLAHISQHKDHAHKKLRHCLQKSSTNLAVIVALRLSEYEAPIMGAIFSVEVKTLAQENLTEQDVRAGLRHLAAEGLLVWHGEETVEYTSEQRKRLARFYEEGE